MLQWRSVKTTRKSRQSECTAVVVGRLDWADVVPIWWAAPCRVETAICFHQTCCEEWARSGCKASAGVSKAIAAAKGVAVDQAATADDPDASFQHDVEEHAAAQSALAALVAPPVAPTHG